MSFFDSYCEASASIDENQNGCVENGVISRDATFLLAATEEAEVETWSENVAKKASKQHPSTYKIMIVEKLLLENKS